MRMRKIRIRYRTWILLLLIILAIGLATQRWDTHQKRQQLVIEMIGDNQDNERTIIDEFRGKQLSIRILVDTGGVILLVLGTGTLIAAIVCFHRRR